MGGDRARLKHPGPVFSPTYLKVGEEHREVGLSPCQHGPCGDTQGYWPKLNQEACLYPTGEESQTKWEHHLLRPPQVWAERKQSGERRGQQYLHPATDNLQN